MNRIITPEKALNRRGRRTLGFALLALVGSVFIQFVGLIIIALLGMSQNSTATITLYQLIGAGSVALGMVVLGGAVWLKPSREDVSYMWRKGWPIVAIDVVLMLIMCWEYFSESTPLAPDWLPNLGVTALLCVGIGIFEELMYRGIILNGLLAVLGKNHRGTMIAVGVTSLLFGLGHVDLSTDFAAPLLATQAVLKIVQTGLFSVILCGFVLRTHRLGGACIFHGLTDFLLMVPSIALVGESLSTNYVSSGAEGYETIVVYLIIIAFYLPFAIRALRSMHRNQVTYRGVFMEKSMRSYDLPTPPATAQPNAA